MNLRARLPILFNLIPALLAAAPHTIHMADDGEPFALHNALREARELRRTGDAAIAEGIRIIVPAGTHALAEPLLLRPEDSGVAASPTVIEAAPGTLPVLSGGVGVTGWARLDGGVAGLPEAARGRVWVAPSPRVAGRQVELRQLWVGDRKADRARDRTGNAMRRVLAWDREQRCGWIPVDEIRAVAEPQRLELVVHQMWAISILRVKDVVLDGDRARLTFHEPESRVQFEHPWPPVVIQSTGNSAYYLANHIALLDEPGEWYQDLDAGKLYYWPREGENPQAEVVTAPVLETLIQVEGTPDRPVGHVRFSGIQFSHTAWTRPSRAGHVPLQAGMYLLDAYKLRPPGTPDKRSLENQAWIGRQPAAVEVRGADSLSFTGCHFRNLGGSGLDIAEAASGITVEGCLFRDIGCNGVVFGKFSDRGIETHLPYDPADERLLCRDSLIANNLVTDVANEDWGCIGIVAGFVRGLTIAHNEVCDVSYTGISLGWGWTFTVNAMRDNTVTANHIHHFGKRMYDTGGIYTLSPQPKSLISENFIHSIYRPAFVHDPNHWSYIYLDEGSSFFTVRDNWTEGLKFSTNANGPGNTWENNGPSVSAKVLQRAGIAEPHRGLRAHATVQPDDPVEL
jgi:hypothetical protein